MKRAHIAAIAAGTMALGAIGATTIVAQEDEETEPTPPGTPGTFTEEDALLEAGELPEDIETSGSYDDTLLTKFIPGGAFVADLDAGDELDYVGAGRCVSAGSGSAGAIAIGYAAVELPDGARIKQIQVHGIDDDASDISVFLRRLNSRLPLVFFPATPTPTFTSETVDSFNTSSASGEFWIVGDDDLEERTGSFAAGGGIALTGTDHRFHAIEVQLNIGAGDLHQVCGVEVIYQVAAADEEAGTVFFPIDPVRAYDSRLPFPTTGPLAPNQSRVISVKDGYTGTTVSTADAVPAGATAVTYNVTVVGPTGPNFVSVTPGDAAGYTTSAANFDGSTNVANAGTVRIDGEREITVWAGGEAGSFDFIIDVTGYYAAPVDSHPNMGN